MAEEPLTDKQTGFGTLEQLRSQLRARRMEWKDGEYKRVRFLAACSFGWPETEWSIPQGAEGWAFISRTNVEIYFNGGLRGCSLSEVEVLS